MFFFGLFIARLHIFFETLFACLSLCFINGLNFGRTIYRVHCFVILLLEIILSVRWWWLSKIEKKKLFNPYFLFMWNLPLFPVYSSSVIVRIHFFKIHMTFVYYRVTKLKCKQNHKDDDHCLADFEFIIFFFVNPYSGQRVWLLIWRNLYNIS